MILLQAPTVNIAVDGEGLLRFVKGGTLVYAQRASLRASNGIIVNESGLPLAPKITVKGSFAIGLDGTINASGKAIGRIVLTKVSGGKATLMNPGEGLAGVIRPAAAILAKTASKIPAPLKNITAQAVAPKSSKISINVRPESQLDGERILLGSVAEIATPTALKAKLAALDLGKLPPLGTSRTIGAAYVRALVRGVGLKIDGFELVVPAGATVSRLGVIVEAQTILDEAVKGVDGYIPAPTRTVTPMSVPNGALQLTTAAGPRGALGMSVVVTATVDGKAIAHRTVSLIPDPNVPTVKVGEAVRLRLLSGSAGIEMPAKVKIGGRQGTEITVVTAHGSSHTGRLLPNGLVEVRL